MRILVLSDIHANIVALDKVLEAAGAYDALWCLGDVVGYGPSPDECVEQMRELKAVALAGNHDWAVLGKLSVEDFNPNARRAVVWTQGVLTADNRDWLGRLPDRLVMPDHDMTLVHGSPRYPIWEYILTTTIASENLRYFETRVCLFGHTHVPILFYQPGGVNRVRAEWLAEGEPVQLASFEKCLFNPGSVGQPRDRDPRAAYAVLDLEARTLTHYRVPYDISKTQAAMRKVGLPQPLVARLEYGV